MSDRVLCGLGRWPAKRGKAMTEEQTRPQQRETPVEGAELEKRFLKYTFFKVAREWRSARPGLQGRVQERVPRGAGEVLPSQALILLPRWDPGGRRLHDTHRYREPGPVPGPHGRRAATKPGAYLETPFSYLAMTKPSRYMAPTGTLVRRGPPGSRRPPPSSCSSTRS